MGRYDELLKRSETSLAYWSEQPTLEFIDSICRLMDQRKMKRVDLARALGTSRAYVTKLLSGRANFTMTKMVQVALAVGGALHTHVADRDAVVHWLEGFVGERAKIVRFDASGEPMLETYVAQAGADTAQTGADTGTNFSREVAL